jgi:hypothetical protein
MKNLENSLIYNHEDHTTDDTRSLIGRRVVDVRTGTDEEALAVGMNEIIVITFDDGTKLCVAGGTLLVPNTTNHITTWNRDTV